MTRHKTYFNRFMKDKDGKVVVWQTPNLPLWVWAAATVLTKIVSQDEFHQALEFIAFGAIFTWAWLEISAGASYFRRTLGAVVLILSIYSRAV